MATMSVTTGASLTMIGVFLRSADLIQPVTSFVSAGSLTGMVPSPSPCGQDMEHSIISTPASSSFVTSSSHSARLPAMMLPMSIRSGNFAFR